jgi:hypothetical protein
MCVAVSTRRSRTKSSSVLNSVALAVYKIDYSDVDEKPEMQFMCLKRLVGERGFEPPTPWSRTRCSTRLSHSPTDYWMADRHCIYGDSNLDSIAFGRRVICVPRRTVLSEAALIPEVVEPSPLACRRHAR